jgi:peptidoglycan DL-endopeptidase CwlO
MLHNKTKIPKRSLLIAAAIALLVSSFAIYFNPASQAVSTEELRRKAQALEAKINENNAAATALADQANSLETKIKELDLEIVAVSDQIKLTSIKLQELEVKLQEAQKELDRQKGLLKASVVTLYKKGGASEVELLVGADSFTSYFNEQLYLERLKAGVQESTEKVIALKQQIQAQKEEQKQLLADQELQKQKLAQSRSERQQILAETRGQESAYRERSERLAAEQRKIFDEILKRSRVVATYGSGGYPWSNAVCVSSGQVDGSCRRYPIYEWVSEGSVLDPWGYYKRNCTSYVAWRVATTGREVPRGMGDGGNWYYSAGYKGIARGTEPKVGAAASFALGGFGHVAYVEEIFNNGTIRISEYNFVKDGVYSERIINKSSVTGYVYF